MISMPSGLLEGLFGRQFPATLKTAQFVLQSTDGVIFVTDQIIGKPEIALQVGKPLAEPTNSGRSRNGKSGGVIQILGNTWH